MGITTATTLNRSYHPVFSQTDLTALSLSFLGPQGIAQARRTTNCFNRAAQRAFDLFLPGCGNIDARTTSFRAIANLGTSLTRSPTLSRENLEKVIKKLINLKVFRSDSRTYEGPVQVLLSCTILAGRLRELHLDDAIGLIRISSKISSIASNCIALTKLSIERSNCSNADIAPLSKLMHLQVLSLKNSRNLSAGSITILANLPALTSLDLFNCSEITPIDFIRLMQVRDSLPLPQLHHLGLGGSLSQAFSFTALSTALAAQRQLATAISTHAKELKTLDLQGTYSIFDTLAQITRSCTHLYFLNIHGCTWISPPSVEILRNLSPTIHIFHENSCVAAPCWR
jgi:hypothetical protein